MTSVWLVTTGDYSDYKVVIAFTTKELAEAYASAENAAILGTYRDEVGVEEFPLFDRLPLPRTVVWGGQAKVRAGVFEGDYFWSDETPEWEPPNLPAPETIVRNGVTYFTVRGLDRALVEQQVREWVAGQLGVEPEQ